MGSFLSFISKYRTHLGITLLVIITISGVITILNSENKPRVRDDFSVQANTIGANTTQTDPSTKITGIENSSLKFAQITDIHITINRPESIERFEKTVEEINSRNIDFVILTGDLVDWSEKPNWEEFRKIYKKINPPAFATVGNHDYRRNLLNVVWPAFPIPSWKPENRKALNYYYNHLAPNPEDLSENFSFDFGPSNGDFSFDYGPAHVVVLDSGHDVISKGFGVQSSGLTDSQINWLEDDLQNEENIFIAMHHPVFTDENLTFSSCITLNRKKFLNISKNQNVVTILTGHTHKNTTFDHEGVTHIQTDNPPAFRIITFDNKKTHTGIIGRPHEPKNITILLISQVWAGVKWAHLGILKQIRTLVGKPANILFYGVIILTGLGLTYKFILLREKVNS